MGIPIASSRPLLYNMQGMSKRKINQQQQRRVAVKQAKILDTPELSGLVIAHHGQNLEIEDANGTIIMCNKRQHLGPIVPGDRIKWQLDPVGKTGVVMAIEPRTTLLTRPDTRGGVHAVAANVDQMFITIAPNPAPSQTTIDRYLIAAANKDIEPIIVLNKEDLLPDDRENAELLILLNIYAHIGIKIIAISAKKALNLPALHQMLANKISVFVGQSGVGKSSIISTFLPDTAIKIGDLSSLKQGKHTTTNGRLYHIPQLHGSIIDSPGMREFPLWQLELATLAYGFIEFRPYLQDCKFRNCTHKHEPNCGLLNAVSEGKISQIRLSSYQKIADSMTTNNH